MTTFFTSDTHFGHAGSLCWRTGFRNVDEMDGEMVRRWNAVVTAADDVYHLGDFSFGDRNYSAAILRALRGRKHLVAGNHDDRRIRALEGWSSVQDYLDLRLDGRKIVLFHYPIAVWRSAHRERLHLHGHCHGSYQRSTSTCLDVGTDCWDYRPVTLAEIDARATALPPWVPLDGHRPEEGGANGKASER